MLGRHLTTYLLPNAAQALASFGMVAVMTRLLSDASYGRYSLIFTMMTLAHYLCLTWTEAAASRFYTKAKADGALGEHSATILRGYLISAAIFIGLSLAIIQFWAKDDVMKVALIAALSGVLLRCLLRISLEQRRMALEVRHFAIVDSLHTLLAFGFSVAAVAIFGLKEQGIFIGMLAAAVLAVAIELPRFLASAKSGTPEPERLKNYVAFGAPISFGLIMSLGLSSGDRFLIDHYLSEADVGAYSAGYQIATRIMETFFVWAASATYPLLLNAYEHEGQEAMDKAARASFSLRFGIGAPAAIGLAMVSGPLCYLLIGEGLRASATQIAPYIALSALMAGMMDYFSDAFMLAKKVFLRAVLLVLPMAINIALNIFWLPTMGLQGAIWATLIAYGIGLILLAAVSRKFVALPVPMDQLAKIALSTAVMALALYLLPAIGGLGELALKATIGAIIYAVLAIWLNIGDIAYWVMPKLSRFLPPSKRSGF